MAVTTDDASNGAAEPKLSFQDQMAAIKQNSTEAEDDSSSTTNDRNVDASNDTNNGAEANGSSTGEDGNDTSSNDSQDDSSAAGGENDDASSNDEGKQFEGRFTQFKGDGTSDTYVKNLEEGYQNSSQEAIRLKDVSESFERQVDAIKQAAASDPEFGERLLGLLNGKGAKNDGNTGAGKSNTSTNDSSSSENPFLKDAETNWNKESEKEAKEFTDANSEILTDLKINAEVKRWMRVFSNETFDSEGRLMKAGEAMRKAYAYLGYEDKTNKTQDLVNGMKQSAAPSRPAAKKTAAATKAASNGSKQFSNLTLDIASRMNISKDRLSKGVKR